MIHPAPLGERVVVYHYPYENDDSQVERALSQFGLVKDVSYQSWVSLKGVHTGTQIVRMDRKTRIPRSIMIDGFRCKIWYRGQPVTCNVCREEGHAATKCSKKGTCFLIVTSRGMCPVTAPIDPMTGSVGASRPKVSPWFPSQMGPLVVGPLPLRLLIPSPFLWWGLAHWARPFLLLPPPSSGGGGSSDGGVAPVSVPDSELSLSVCGESSAASTVLNSQGYIVSIGYIVIRIMLLEMQTI